MPYGVMFSLDRICFNSSSIWLVNFGHRSGILRNLYNDDDIGSLLQVIIWWDGLMKGVVSIALAFNQIHIYTFVRSLCAYLQFM